MGQDREDIQILQARSGSEDRPHENQNRFEDTHVPDMQEEVRRPPKLFQPHAIVQEDTMTQNFNYNERMNEIRRENEEMKRTAHGYVKEVFMSAGAWNGVELIMPDKTIIKDKRDWIKYEKRTELEAEKYESHINGFCGR